MSVTELRFRSPPVPYFGVFFSWFTSNLGYTYPTLRKTTINLVPGDLTAVSAVANGEADMGLATPPVCCAMAYRGVGPYERKMENLRAIGSFPHDDRLMWAATEDSGLRSIEDMTKKSNLTLAIPGAVSPVHFAVERILEGYGTSLQDLKKRGWKIVGNGDSIVHVVPFVTRGEADVVVHEGRKTPPWAELTVKRRMRFLPTREDILKHMVDRYGFRRGVLARGMLNGVTEDIPTLDWSEWALFVRDDMPDDLALTITKIFVEKKEFFELGFKGLPMEKSDLIYPVDPRKVWTNVGVSLHPAAERYYKEKGYMS